MAATVPGATILNFESKLLNKFEKIYYPNNHPFFNIKAVAAAVGILILGFSVFYFAPYDSMHL